LTIIGVLWGTLLAGATALGQEGLQVGDPAPEFTCLDDQGQVWKLRDHLGMEYVVVYFYPSDFSFCCTRQASRYRDSQDKLAERGVTVVGVSGDAVASHQMFKEAHGLPFTLLADVDGSIARQFGVPLRSGGKSLAADADGKTLLGASGRPVQSSREFTAARWTFVIGKDGSILYRDTHVSPVKDAQVVLEFLDQQVAR
jgi:peroxiredoxin Q/BCP